LHTDKQFTQTVPNDAIVTEGTKSYIFIVDNEALESKENAEHDDHDLGVEEKADAHADNDEHEGHDHDTEEKADTHADNDSGHNNSGEMAFRMVEVITGLKDDGYTQITLVDSLPENTQVVLNSAYYLLSEIGKGETSHEH